MDAERSAGCGIDDRDFKFRDFNFAKSNCLLEQPAPRPWPGGVNHRRGFASTALCDQSRWVTVSPFRFPAIGLAALIPP
jgi:hypothetical protein